VDTPEKYIECGFTQFCDYCEILAERIILQEGDAIAVLNAKRDGGVYLSRIVELEKGVEIYELNYSVTQTENGLLVEIIGPFPPGLVNRHVYLLTDIVNSGWIACPVVSDLKERNNEVTLAPLYHRIGSDIPLGIRFTPLIRVDCGVRFRWEQG
jgi:hypothetical protein